MNTESVEALIARLVQERDQARVAHHNAIGRANEYMDEARQARACLAVLIPYAGSGIDKSCASAEEDEKAFEALQKAKSMVPWHDKTDV